MSPFLEKADDCPQCSEIKSWNYDGQTCGRCGYGTSATPSPSPVGVDAMRRVSQQAYEMILTDHPAESVFAVIKSKLPEILLAALASTPQSVPAGTRSTREELARDIITYCLANDVLTQHGMAGLRKRLEIAISADAETMYRALLRRADKLMDAERNTLRGHELDILANALVEYEKSILDPDKPVLPAGTRDDGIEAAARVAERFAAANLNHHAEEEATPLSGLAQIIANEIRNLKSQPAPAGRDSGTSSGEFHGLDNERQVFFYEQDFYVLSNFSSFRLKWCGVNFDTSEHAYHFQRFRPQFDEGSNDQRRLRGEIMNARSAHEAFRLAQDNKHLQRPDWNEIKVGVMRDLLRAKADQHEYVRRKLLATGDRELIENSWRDDFWGWGPNRDGQNMLGKLWMEVRAELRASKASAPSPSAGGDLSSLSADSQSKPAGRDEETTEALKAASFLIDEITDLEGREGLTDYDFAEQVIALAHSMRDQIRAALASAPQSVPAGRGDASDYGKVAIALGFLGSAVRCGEEFGDEHKRVIREAFEALDRISAMTAGTRDDGIEAALDAARNELERLLFNQPSETTHKVIEQIKAALKQRGDGATISDAETVQTLLDLLNPLHGSLDEQTYDDKMRQNFDPLPEDEYSVNITSRMESDLSQAVLILEDRKRQFDALKSQPAPAGGYEETIEADTKQQTATGRLDQRALEAAKETAATVLAREPRPGINPLIAIEPAIRAYLDHAKSTADEAKRRIEASLLGPVSGDGWMKEAVRRICDLIDEATGFPPDATNHFRAKVSESFAAIIAEEHARHDAALSKSGEVKITKAQRAILEEADEGSRASILRVVGIHRPGNYKAMVKHLVAAGLLRHVGPSTVTITDAGRAALSEKGGAS